MRGRYRLLFPVLVTLGLVAPGSARAGRATAGIRDGDWIGAFTLPASAAPVAVDLQLHGTTAAVALGPGHAALHTTTVHRRSSSISFSLPGVPAPLAFSFRLRGRALTGSARQGAATGKARLVPATPSLNRFLGTYRTTAGDFLVVNDLRRLGPPIWLIDVGTDLLRGMYRVSATNYAIGAGTATRDPVAGSIHFARDGFSLTATIPGVGAVQATRVRFSEEEVRFRNGGVTLAGTLTLPEGSGPFPAVMMVHGSGASLRDEGQTFSNFLAAHGIASLTPDKRGVGQSGGIFPGEFASEAAVATYSADAIAGGLFLATQHIVDQSRIGLFGGSQAGWIIPLAAAHARALFSFAEILSGPVLSVAESDYYAQLTHQGDYPPEMTPDQIDAAVRKLGPGGVDPRPVLRTLRIPIFWVYGGLDQNQPTRLDVPVLEELKASTHADFSWVVFPDANHGLVITKTGLNVEAAAAPGFAHGLFASIDGWFRAHAIGK